MGKCYNGFMRALADYYNYLQIGILALLLVVLIWFDLASVNTKEGKRPTDVHHKEARDRVTIFGHVVIRLRDSSCNPAPLRYIRWVGPPRNRSHH